MKRTSTIALGSLFAASLFTGFAATRAQAEPPATVPKGASVDNPELRAQFEARRLTPPVTPQIAVQPELMPNTQVTNVLTLEAVLDRAVLVWFEIPAGGEAMLQSTGAVRVSSAEDVGHNTIWSGRYYRLIRLAETAPDDASLQKFTGLPMRFDIAMRGDGRQVVLDVRRP